MISKFVLHPLPTCRHMGCFVSWNDAEKNWAATAMVPVIMPGKKLSRSLQYTGSLKRK